VGNCNAADRKEKKKCRRGPHLGISKSQDRKTKRVRQEAKRFVQRAYVLSKYKRRSQFWEFHKRNQRRAILVCHRRAGKTVATLNDLIM
jgi:hypothetical protein